MPLRVGFDLDGTVADMHFALKREAIALFGEDVIREAEAQSPSPQEAGAEQSGQKVDAVDDEQATRPVMQELRLTARQQSQLWDHVKKIDNFWNTLPELEPGIIKRLARNVAERRWEVIFLTTRPTTAGDLVQLQSQRWLHEQGFEYPSVFVVRRSRGRIADALGLDAFVDDRPENCLDVAVESKAKVILVWHGDPKDIPAGAKRIGVQPVQTISEALVLLEKLDDVRAQPSLMRTIKRAFGKSDPQG